MLGTPALAAARAQLRYQTPLTAEVLACVQSALPAAGAPAFSPQCARELSGPIQQHRPGLLHAVHACTSHSQRLSSASGPSLRRNLVCMGHGGHALTNRTVHWHTHQ